MCKWFYEKEKKKKHFPKKYLVYIDLNNLRYRSEHMNRMPWKHIMRYRHSN